MSATMTAVRTTTAEALKCAPTEHAVDPRGIRALRALLAVPRTTTVEAVKFAPTALVDGHRLREEVRAAVRRVDAHRMVTAEAVRFVWTECAVGRVLEEARVAAEAEAE